MNSKLKPIINEQYPILDLFTDNVFFQKFNPVIIKLKKPITLIHNNTQEELIFTQFIAQETQVEKIQTAEFFIPGYLDSESYASLNITPEDIKIQKNPSMEHVIDVLKNTKTNCGQQISPLFSLEKCSATIFSTARQHHRIIEMALLNIMKDSNHIDLDKFTRCVPASKIEAKTFEYFILSPHDKEKVKKTLSIYYDDYIKEGILGHGKLFFRTPNNTNKFSKEWLSSTKQLKEKNVFTLIDTLSFTSQEDKLNFEIKAIKNIISKTEMINSIMIERYKDLPEKQLETIYSELNSIENTKGSCNPHMFLYGFGNIFKEIITETKKEISLKDLAHIQHSENIISFEVPWQKIFFEKVDLPVNLSKMYEFDNNNHGYKSIEYCKYSKEIISYYSSNLTEDSALNRLLECLANTYKTLHKIHPCGVSEDEELGKIYTNDNKLFIDLLFPTDFTEAHRLSILEAVIKNINMNTLENPSSNERILKAIIDITINNNTTNEDIENTHFNDFKI